MYSKNPKLACECMLTERKTERETDRDRERLTGESNAGKAGLTRPLIKLFGDRTWLPRFAYGALIWQDWRLESNPMAWDTLRLCLEGESVTAAIKGSSSSIAVHHLPPFVITCQSRVLARGRQGAVDEQGRAAFNNRLGLKMAFCVPTCQAACRSRTWRSSFATAALVATHSGRMNSVMSMSKRFQSARPIRTPKE